MSGASSYETPWLGALNRPTFNTLWLDAHLHIETGGCSDPPPQARHWIFMLWTKIRAVSHNSSRLTRELSLKGHWTSVCAISASWPSVSYNRWNSFSCSAIAVKKFTAGIATFQCLIHVTIQRFSREVSSMNNAMNCQDMRGKVFSLHWTHYAWQT